MGRIWVAAVLPRAPGTVCLPASVSMSGEPYLGQRRWQIRLAWRWTQFGPERPGHDPSCLYCAHGPDCLSCPLPPTEAGPLTACGPCSRDVLTADPRAQTRAEAYFASLC